MTNAESNFELAVTFIKGEGVEKDVNKATALLTEAAAAGHIKAQYNLGVMYLNGIGTGKDIDKATDCFKQAANQGHEQARHALEKICKTLSITEIQTPIEAGVSPNPHEKLNECLACQSCNKYNLLTAKFCVNCGVKLQGKIESISIKPSHEHANARSIDATSESNPIVMQSNNAGGTAPARPNVAQAPETGSPVASVKINAEGLSFLLLFFFAGCALVAGHFGWNIAIYIFCGLYAVSFAKWKVSKPNFTWAKPTVATLLFVVILGVVLQHNDLDVTLPNQYSADSALMNDQTYRAAKSVVSNMRNGGLCEVLAHEIMEYATDLSLPQRMREIYVNKFINKAMQRNCM